MATGELPNIKDLKKKPLPDVNALKKKESTQQVQEEVSTSVSQTPAQPSTESGEGIKQEVKQEEYKEPDFFTGKFGSFLKAFDAANPYKIPVGEFIDDMGRAISGGQKQGSTVGDALYVMTKGKNVSDEDIQAYIDIVNESQNQPVSEAMFKFQKELQEKANQNEDKQPTFWDVFSSLNAGVVPEIIVSSLSAMVNPESAAAAGTVVGGSAAGGALFGGAGAVPAALASTPYALAAAGTTLETAVTFSELLQNELAKEQKEFNKENVKELLQNEDKLNSIRAKAVGRGFTIGAIDAMTGKLGGSVGAKVAKKAFKGAKPLGVATTSVIESVGGSGGEAAGRLVAGQEMDKSEIVLEGIGEIGQAPLQFGSAMLNTDIDEVKKSREAAKKKANLKGEGFYEVNGEVVTRGQLTDMLKNMTEDDLTSELKIDIENDPEMTQMVNDLFSFAETKQKVKSANPNLSEDNLVEVARREQEISMLKDNDTETAKERVSKLKEEIKSIQEQPQESKDTTEQKETTTQKQDTDKILLSNTYLKPPNSAMIPIDEALKYIGEDRLGEDSMNDSRERIDDLKKDIKKNGLKESLIMAYQNGEVSIIEGNHRIQALKELGYKEVPITLRTQPLPSKVNRVDSPIFAEKERGSYTFDEIGIPNKKYKSEDFKKQDTDAIQEQAANESVLRQEQPEVGLQEVVEGDQKQEVVTEEGKAQEEVKPEKEGKKKRGFAKSAQKAFTGLKDRIQKNPENYYEPQKWATMKGRISEMTEEELIQNMDEKGLNVVKDGDENNSILAGIELINRRIADDKPIDDLVERFAKEGTKMGQLIAQFKDLNSSTPFGIMSTINKIAERKGKILSPQQKKNIQDLAQEMLKAVNKLQQHIQEKGGKATNEDIKTLKKLNKEAESKSREFYKFVAPFTPMTWSEMLQMSTQGNLITLGSQVTNVVANVGQQTILTPVNSVASLADLMSSIFTKKRVGSFDPRQFGYAWLGRYEYLKKAIKKIVFGDTSYVKGEVKNSFDPLNAAVQSLSETKVGDLIGIPQGLIPKSISEKQQERLREAKKLESDGDVEAANKIRQEVLDSAKISLSDRLKKVYESTVGVPVEIMFRLLSLGDEPFRGGEIYRQRFIAAKRKGLKGDDIRRFVLMPDAKTQEEINESSKEVVFQEDGVISKMAQKSTSAIKNVAQGIKYVDPVVQFIFRLNVPFVKTPSNIISQLIDYTLPPVALAKAAYYYKKGDQRQGNRNVGVAATGYMMIAAAEFLVANGLVSAAIDWSDEDDKNIKMKVTGSNSLNITGLKRALEGGNPEYKETDDLIDISKFGIPGAAILIRAERARNKIRDKRVKAANIDNDETFLESMINLLGIETLPEVIQFSFEQSFLAGTSTLLEALKGGEYEAKRWFKQMTSAASAIVLPNTLGQLNRATETYLPDTRVESLPDAINALITSKIGFAVGDNYPEFPIRVDMWGNPIRRTPEGKNPYFYQFFDITKSREVPKDPLSLEIYQLYKLTQNPKVVPNMPSRIYFDDGIKYEIPKSIDGNKLYNEYASKVQKIKRKYAENEFKKSSYKNSSIEKRVERMSNALSKYQNSFEYKKARKELIKTLKSKKFD